MARTSLLDEFSFPLFPVPLLPRRGTCFLALDLTRTVRETAVSGAPLPVLLACMLVSAESYQPRGAVPRVLGSNTGAGNRFFLGLFLAL